MNISVGNKIKKLRTTKNMTQSKLAKRIGVADSTVSSYEVNDRQPSYDALIKIAKLFKVTTDYLLGLDLQRIDYSDMIDITGLDARQRAVIDDIVEAFKQNNEHIKPFSPNR